MLDFVFDSDSLYENLRILKHSYPFIQSGYIGKSVLGKNIPFIRLGNGPKEVFYNASFHANEWITSSLVMKFVEDFCRAYVNNSSIFGYSADYIFNTTSIYIVPMVNPDGVDLVTGSINTGSSIYANCKRIADNFPDVPFPSGWKANINGVDLNLQFPAGWENAKKIKYEQGFDKPAPRDFVGYRSSYRA